jgi:hypothetical protein
MRSHKLLSTLFVILAAAASCLAQSPSEVAAILPDAPEPQPPYVVASRPTPPPRTRPTPGFFTFRKSYKDPPLRTNKEVFHSKTFLLLNGALLAAVVVDIQHTHGARESWGSELPAVGGAIGLDYLMDRFFTRAYAVEGPIFGIQHYVRDAFRGK